VAVVCVCVGGGGARQHMRTGWNQAASSWPSTFKTQPLCRSDASFTPSSQCMQQQGGQAKAVQQLTNMPSVPLPVEHVPCS
jgi:hypothetical protein